MDDNIQNYRQRMVTAIEIILGFVLGFTGKWATEPVIESDMSDALCRYWLIYEHYTLNCCFVSNFK